MPDQGMRIDRSDIVDKIQNRFGGEISKLLLEDATKIICEHLIDSLMHDQSIFVHNFGTLHTIMYKSHVGRHIISGELQYIKPLKSVKFSPHITLIKLLKEKKSLFLDN